MMLELDNVTHSYGDKQAVEDVTFGVEAGELVALVGPSGCGKTTLVQAVAGHVRPTAGRVVLRDRDVTALPPESRQVGIVFQQPTLYPHMTAGENVAYGLATRESDAGRRSAIVDEYLELVDLSDRRDAYPRELSGGEKRRVELARALAPEPDVLLLDESLSALDRGLRVQLREEIARIQRETGVTTLFVTHEQEDAMALADRLVVLNGGRVAGVGEPRTLYESPPTRFVASFLGRSNMLSGTVAAEQSPTVAIGEQELLIDGADSDAVQGSVTAGQSVVCHVRPDALTIKEPAASGTEPLLDGEVVQVRDVGSRYDITVEVAGENHITVEQSTAPPAPGDAVVVVAPRDKLTIFAPAKTSH